MKREYRYLVLKYKDIKKYLSEAEQATIIELASIVDAGRIADGKKMVDCVVVERDWPEYEPTWAAIERRMDIEKQEQMKK